MNGKTKRIFLESTLSLDTTFTTGIQRVVRSIIAEADALSQQIEIECIPVVFRKDRFYDAKMAWRKETLDRDQGVQSTSSRLTREIDRLSPRAAQLYSSTLVRLRKILYPKTVARAMVNASWQLRGKPVSFCDTDILLLLDETTRLPIWSAVEHARAQGCCVGAVVYDLIPIDYPQFFREKFVDLFAEGLNALLQHSDFLLPISKTVASRLKKHISTTQPQNQFDEKRVAPFRLGAATAKVPVKTSVHSRLQHIFNANSGNMPYLSVGTIEPRKNHQYLLDAFEVAWSRNPNIKLCIVGRVGWKCQDTLERIKLHPQFGKSLFLFTNLSDEELFFCYRQARALVSCSVDEGFGLPIIEGLCHDLHVLASDIPVHREIGQKACDYFDLADPSSLAMQVLDLERNGTSLSGREADTFSIATWQESCEDLFSKALALTNVVKTEREQAPQEEDNKGIRKLALATRGPASNQKIGNDGARDVQVHSY